MAKEVIKEEHVIPADVAEQIVNNLREYGDFMKPGYGMGYNAASKTNYQWSSENFARWAAYDAAYGDETRPTGFVLHETAKDKGYRIKPMSQPLQILRYRDGETITENYYNLADLVARKKDAEPFEALPRTGDTEADYKLAGDMLEALNIDRSIADQGNAAGIIAAVEEYARNQEVEIDKKKIKVTEIPAKLTASIFLRKHNILPPADPIVSEAQINFIEANPKELTAALRISANVYKDMDRAYYMATNKEYAQGKSSSFDINAYLDKNTWNSEDWNKVLYHYVENLPEGKDIKEFDMDIAKKMAMDGLSDKRIMQFLKGINRMNHYEGPDVSIDVVNSQEFQEFRKEFPIHISKQAQEKMVIKGILNKAKLDHDDWSKLAYHYNVPLKEGMDVVEHNLRVAKRMAWDNISDGKMKVVLDLVNKFNKVENPDVVENVIHSQELKDYKEEVKQSKDKGQNKKQAQAQSKAKVMAK